MILIAAHGTVPDVYVIQVQVVDVMRLAPCPR
jgi:hypothetical protein